MSKELLELPNKKDTFTLKRDFNMVHFLLEAKPDEAFKTEKESNTTFIRTNTSSNIKLKDNIELGEDDVIRLIKANRTVVIYYEVEKRLDAYNFKDAMQLLDWVIAS